MSDQTSNHTQAQRDLIAKHGTVAEFTRAALASVGEISFKEAEDAIREYQRDFNNAGRQSNHMNKISIHSNEIHSFNIIKVEAGTNCPKGGDSGHGGRTVFRLTDLGGTDMRVSLNGGPMKSVDKVEILLGGDCEAECFIEALEFAVRILRGQYGAPHTDQNVEEETE